MCDETRLNVSKVCTWRWRHRAARAQRPQKSTSYALISPDSIQRSLLDLLAHVPAPETCLPPTRYVEIPLNES